MNYLFFDIECANCFKGIGKICEFGYVLCDSKFNLLKKENIFINPQAPFHFANRSEKDNFSLSKPESFYKDFPNFEAHYKEIKKILNAKNQIVFAYSSSNDISFLLTTLRRYHLANIGCTIYDAQKIAAKFIGSNKYPGLEMMHDLLCPNDEEIIAHEASNDAYMTMEVVREIIKKAKTTLKDYMDQIPNISNNLLEEMEKLERKEKLRKLTSLVFVSDKNKINDKKYRKKRYFIGYDVKKDYDLHIKVLNKLAHDHLYLVGGLSNTDKVIYKDKDTKKYYKKIFKWPNRKYKFVEVNKLLGK